RVGAEAALLEPGELRARHPLLERAEADGRKDAGEAGGCAGGERERAVVLGPELVDLIRLVAEAERVPVTLVMDKVGIGDRDLPVVAVEVGDRDEQLQQ